MFRIIIIFASEPDRLVKFKRFMLLFDKTQRERRTIGQCKATNDLQFFSHFFKINSSYAIALVTLTKGRMIHLELLTLLYLE